MDKKEEGLIITPELAKAKRDEKFKQDPGSDIGMEERKLAEGRREIDRDQFLIFDTDSEGEIKRVTVNITKIANYLMNIYSIKTIYETKSEKIYVYSNGVYNSKGRETIQTEVEYILGNHSNNHCVREIQEKVKRLTVIEREEFDNIPEHLICLENGILDLKTLELKKHNPQYYFKRKIPIVYDPKKECPIIMKFLEECLYPEDIAVIQEWFGFNLYRNYFIKKMVILFGKTNTGKSLLLKLLTNFLGEKNISGLSLQRIAGGDKFGLAGLKDKYANIFDDLTNEDMLAGGSKQATGGGWITAEYKFGDSFIFKTFAKLTFAGNKIPSVKDIDSDDDAYYDRWIPLALDNQVEKKNQDPYLIDKMTTNEELSGLLNWSLIGLGRLFNNNFFSFEMGWVEIKELMGKYSGNPLEAFCLDVLVEDTGHKITKEEMFQVFNIYAKEKRIRRLTKEQLGRSLHKYLNYVIDSGGKVRSWINVNLNENYFWKDDTNDTFFTTICRNRKEESVYTDKIPEIVSLVSIYECSECGLKTQNLTEGICELCLK